MHELSLTACANTKGLGVVDREECFGSIARVYEQGWMRRIWSEVPEGNATNSHAWKIGTCEEDSCEIVEEIRIATWCWSTNCIDFGWVMDHDKIRYFKDSN